MKMIVCSVFDSVSGLYARPIYVPSAGAAVRMFTDEVNRDASDNAMFKHASDFQLYQMGEFEDTTGVSKWIVPELLCTGAGVKL